MEWHGISITGNCWNLFVIFLGQIFNQIFAFATVNSIAVCHSTVDFSSNFSFVYCRPHNFRGISYALDFFLC